MSASAASGPGFSIEPLGESALLLRFGEGLDAATNARVHAASAALQAAHLPGIVDIVPAYATLALHYDPALWTSDDGSAPWRHIADAVRTVFAHATAPASRTSVAIEIPVSYGGAFGPDLDDVARRAQLDAAEVIRRHTTVDYQVAMIGFAPGFPYLLGLDAALETPRRASPRTRVPAGSVAIGGAQTGIYPGESPGGWQLIGRTPAILFDALRSPPSLLSPGDLVRFVAIDAARFGEASRSA